MNKSTDKPDPERPHHLMTNREIGEQLHVSASRIDQIADSAMQKLRKELERRGIRFVSDVVPE